MSLNQISDKVKLYSEERARVNRLGAWLLFVPLVLLALARSPDFKSKDFLGLVEGTFHNGYIAAYGHFVILVLATRYSVALGACLWLRRAVQADSRAKNAGNDADQIEVYLLRPPFWSEGIPGGRYGQVLFTALPNSPVS
jgi:hypothetical protein